jgi:hypothetical protein
LNSHDGAAASDPVSGSEWLQSRSNQKQSSANDVDDGFVVAPAVFNPGWLKHRELFSRQLDQLVFGLQPVVLFVAGLTPVFEVDLIGSGSDLIWIGTMKRHGTITADWLELSALADRK